MDALNQRIVLVTRKTRLEELMVRFNTIEQGRFYVEHLGADSPTMRPNTASTSKRFRCPR
jgi:hypothetical protein